MKYKIYSNGKYYKIPNQEVNTFGDLITAEWDKEVAIRLLDGDILYLTKTMYDGDSPTLLINLESGYCCSAFYVDQANDYIAQCGNSGWMSNRQLFTESGAILRIYKFGDYENTYDLEDIEEGSHISDEQWCRKHGYLAAILKFTHNSSGDECWRVIDPNNPISGQTIDLPNMQDKLFISAWAKTIDGPGFYYAFDSGTEGVGFFVNDGDFDNGYSESRSGWFGEVGFYQEGSKLIIFHCGAGLYEYFDHAETYWDAFYNLPDTLTWLQNEFGSPIILHYDGNKWNLIQEGIRNDF